MRRRRQDKPALPARLILDDHVKGDVGILSDDLFASLFPQGQEGIFSPFVLPKENTLTFIQKQNRTYRPQSIILPSRRGRQMRHPKTPRGLSCPSSDHPLSHLLHSSFHHHHRPCRASP